MSFDRSRVERQRDGIFAGLGQRFKDCAPSPALGPAVEAIVDGRVRTVFTRAIAPSRARLQHVNDPADDAAVVVRSGVIDTYEEGIMLGLGTVLSTQFS